MSLSLVNSFNVTDNATFELDGACYVTTALVGGITYVFVAGRDDNGVSAFSLGADGTLTNVFNFADTALTNLGGAFAVTTREVGGTAYLFVTGVSDYGVSVFSVAADGALTNVANVADNAMLQLALTTDVETAVVDGTTYLFSGGSNDNGVSVFSVGANGALTNVDNAVDDSTSKIQGPQGLTTAVVGGNTYLFVTGYHDDGVGVYSIAANGHLTNVFNVQDSGPLELDGPVDAITAVVGGTTYLFVTGFEDDGVSVFSVAASGALTNVFNLPDNGLLELDTPVGLSTAVLGGKTYLFVAGADDDGFDIFLVAADGSLSSVENVTDNSTLELDRALGVTTVAMNGRIYVIVAGNTDDGVSVFTLQDDFNQAPTLTATGSNPTFTEGGAAADIFSAPVASTIEPGQTFTSLTLTVTNVTDGANEILSFLGHDLALTDGNSVASVTVSVVGTTATVTFPGASDAAALQQLIDDLAYRNTSQNPTNADRIVTITQLTDSGGTADGGSDTATLTIVSTVNVDGANDAAIISGTAVGDVTEAGGVDNGTPTVGGDLDSADVDNTADAWQPVAAGTASISGFGSYQAAANGQWSYTLDSSNAAVQGLNDGATLTDTFSVVTEDGTTQLVTITIHGQNDAAVITGDAAGAVAEAVPTVGGDLDAADVDNTADAWQAVAAGAASISGFGSYQVATDGQWSYTLDNTNTAVQGLNDGATLTDTFSVVTEDGTTQLVTVTIHGQNDAAVITGDAAGAVTEAVTTVSGDLDAADVDNIADAWQAVAAGAASISGFGSYQVAADGQWSYTLDNTNAAVQGLNDGATLTDTFSVATEDGTTQLVTITIQGQNDAAVITGDAAGAVTEAVPTISGDLDSADVDNTADAWQPVAVGTASISGFGSYQAAANGQWSYTLDSSNAAVQGLNDGATLTDTFSVVTEDGTTQLVTITIHGQNDAAVITGDVAGVVTEAAPTVGGDLDAADVDNAADAWQAVAAGAAAANGYGTYQLTAAGVWTYMLDNSNAAVRALQDAETRTDTFTVLTVDGTSQLVTVTINGMNDAPEIDLNGGGAGTGVTFTEGGLPAPIVDINATITDADDGQMQSATVVLTDALAGDTLNVGDLSSFGITSSIDTGVPGRITVVLQGAASRADYREALREVTFSNTSANPSTAGRHIEVSVSDGSLQSSIAIVSLTVIGLNDAPVNIVPGTQSLDANHTLAIAGLAVTDLDAGAAAITASLTVAHGTLTVAAIGGVGIAGSSTHTVTLTGSVEQINAALGAAGNIVYAPTQDYFGADTLTMTTSDQGNSGNAGPLSDTDLIKINVNKTNTVDSHVLGTPGADSFTALPGNALIDGLAGVDTVTFDFRMVDAMVRYQGSKIVIDGPGGIHVQLAGVERFVFTDGTVDNNDGDRMVDDLFYYSKNHDVWNAHADADAHYNAIGWHEGRDPSAFFDTSDYLAANRDVKTAGVNPLEHYHESGWKQGRDPSSAFDTKLYLVRNPDVAAAGIDPLAHFLTSGMAEGRQAYAAIGQHIVNGFDAEFYLMHNPDVAAAGMDALTHYNVLGWHEGRNPNAYFDTAGYLSHYADVAAAGVNPLEHYLLFGWQEGRDPSAGFDTQGYLAANPDVAAAGLNPLDHYLQCGVYEGRDIANDGLWL